jgi:hypothetical protein
MTCNRAQLAGLLTEERGLQGVVATLLHQGLEAQLTAPIGAQPYERRVARKA